MANRQVNITKRVKTPKGLRFCPVVRNANGRIKQDYVFVNRTEEKHPEGSYYLDWMEGPKRYRVAVGRDAAGAYNRQRQKEQELADGKPAEPEQPQFSADPGTVAEAVEKYLHEIQITKKPKTHAAYSISLRYFLESCGNKRLDAVTRTDLINYRGFLRDEKEQAPRSCWNKFSNVVSFLKSQGVRGIVTKNDWPRFVEEEPEIYEEAELDTLFAACTPEERLWFEFFLMTGMREQEVMHVYWSDVNWQHATIRVTHKPDRGWTPKAYKEREIPIPDALVQSLKAYRKESDRTCNLIFPTAGCKPKLDFLDCLKRVAQRAKLNKNNFYLHKFRATFATRCLWGGVDLRTTQSWLGHTDMESTMRYLKPSRSVAVRSKVNEIFANGGAR
jgi:integrase/recombinase XerD